MTCRLSADIGGTFTDLVLVGDDGELSVHKTPSTPLDFTQGILSGVARVLSGREGSPDLHILDSFVHGATVVLNALLQLQLPATGLITTAGFRDVLEIMRTNNPAMYDLHYVKPAPLVPRKLRLEVRERIRHTGQVLESLVDDDVREAARRFASTGVEAVAVCLLHAYANPVHERRVREILGEELPECVVCLSSEVAPEWREFERSSTTCVNAATTPVIRSYLGRLSGELTSRGLQRELLVMQSNGGVMTATAAGDWPVRTVMSGPSGGVVGALALAGEVACSNLVTIDIGGTSSDMGVIADGEAVTIVESAVAGGWPILAPMIEILSIGAGGGSIAWLDPGGALRVGPQSAGAYPAPACYAKGGTEPTVTDANVVLGRIDPDYFLGGEMRLDVDAAREALDKRIAKPTSLDLLDAAAGILRIVNTNMAKAMRSILIERGFDPRDFTVMGFGGGGGLHTAALMRELSIPHAIVPANPGALSALGMLRSDFRHDRSRTIVCPVEQVSSAEVAMLFTELEQDAREALARDGIADTAGVLFRSADLRYAGQEYHLNVPVPCGEATIEADALAGPFHAQHERVYGYATPDFPVELVNLRVTAIGPTPRPRFPQIAERIVGGLAEPSEIRSVYFDETGWTDTAIYGVEGLRAGDHLAGPAIVQDPRSTMLILPGQHGVIDRFSNLHIHEGQP